MKRIISILLVLSTLFLFSCATIEKDNDKPNNNILDGDELTNQTDEQNDIIIYCEDSGTRSFIEAVISDNTSKEVNATLTSASKLNFDINEAKDIQKDSATPDMKKFSVQGKEFEVNYKSTGRKLIANSEKKHLNEIADFISYSSDELRIEYRKSTDEILGFMRRDIHGPVDKEKNLSENEIVDIAKEYLNGLYGEEYMKDYEESTCALDSKTNAYILRFWKYVGEFKTNSYVAMHIYPDGTIKSMTFMNKGIYDNVLGEASQETIDKAYNYMTELFEKAELQTVLNPSIVMNTDGEYFMKFNISTGSNSLDRYYVNLNQFQ